MNKPNLTKALGAGIIGTIVMTLFAAMAPLMGMPEMNIPRMLAGFIGFPTIVGWLAHFMIGTVLALTYAIVLVSKLPGKPVVKGILFGLIPWLMAQLLVNPMMGAGVFAVNTPAPMLMVAGSLMGHVVFGGVVGLVYGTTGRLQVATA
jgi:uncharacterized membrane protein YagU involved in acid resistance